MQEAQIQKNVLHRHGLILRAAASDQDPAEMSQSPQLSGGTALVGGRYEFQFAARLQQLDSPQANAYSVRDLEGGSRHRFALVLRQNGYGRFCQFESFAALEAGGMLRAIAHGTVGVADGEHERMVLILERPAGGRVMAQGSKLPERLDERAVIDRILAPLEESLRALHRAGLTHRAIRPDNLYFRDAADGPAVLGECLSAPPGRDQPDAFEPIESAMAWPAGRGDGTPASDMFALGATVVTLLSGRWPDQRNPPERLLRRIESGSFRALAGRLRCSHDMEDLLAGLLYDDPQWRWNADQFRAWLNRRSVGRRPFYRAKSGSRSFRIEGLSCTTPRAVAYALSRHGDAARTQVAEGDLTRWLERSLGELRMADAVRRIVGDDDEEDHARPKIDDKTISRLCRILDPEGPVYYDGAAVMLDGINHAVAEAILTGDVAAEKALETMLAHALPIERLPAVWSQARQQEIKAQFRAYQGFVRGSAAGTGIERCLYEMNPGIQCQSRWLEGQSVRRLKDLLPALNRVAVGGEIPDERPRDAHITAFLATHMPVPEQQRAANDVSGAALGVQDCIHDLAYFARLQKICGHGPLRNLARWLSSGLKPAIEGYYSRTRRARVAAQLSAVTNSGDLGALLRLVDDRHEQALDREEFAHAVARQNHHARMVAHFHALFAARHSVARAHGRRAAFALGCIVLAVSCVAALGGGLL